MPKNNNVAPSIFSGVHESHPRRSTSPSQERQINYLMQQNAEREAAMVCKQERESDRSKVIQGNARGGMIIGATGGAALGAEGGQPLVGGLIGGTFGGIGGAAHGVKEVNSKEYKEKAQDKYDNCVDNNTMLFMSDYKKKAEKQSNEETLKEQQDKSEKLQYADEGCRIS